MFSRTFNSYEIKGGQLILHANHCMQHARKTSYLPKQHIILVEDGRNFNFYMFGVGLFCIIYSFWAHEDIDLIAPIATSGWVLVINAIYLYFAANVSIYTASTRHKLNCCTADIEPLINWFKSESSLTEAFIHADSSV